MKSQLLLVLLWVACFFAGCESSASDCWPEIVETHNALYFEFDRVKSDPTQVDRIRAELRDRLASCSPDTKFFVGASDLRIGLDASVSLLDIAIIADDSEKTRSFVALLTEGRVTNRKPDDLLYGGQFVHLAAYFESKRAVHELLDLGFDPNEAGPLGMTPLHTSSVVTENGLGVISELVRFGADMEIKAENGETPILMAMRKGDQRKVQCLHALRAKSRTEGRSGGSHSMEEMNTTEQLDSHVDFEGTDELPEIAEWCGNSR